MAAASSSNKSQARGLADSARANASTPLVLVVEDHEDTRFMLKHLLRARGFEVAEARDAGCDDYLVKPVDIDQLDRVLAQRLSGG